MDAAVRGRRRTNRNALRTAAERSLRECGVFPSSVRIDGRLRFLDAGLNHENFLFSVKADEALPDWAEGLVLRRVLSRSDDAESSVRRLRTEAETLRTLERLSCAFDTPRFVCVVTDADGVARALIETALPGLPLRMVTKGADAARSAIDTIGRVAADVHRLPAASFAFLPSHTDAAAHLAAELDTLDERSLCEQPDAADAIAWIRDHRLVDRSAVLLHGDLLPQNLLGAPASDRPCVIDWEYAKIGDPAYDLAIVTRGNRKLLGVERGLRRLVSSYREAGGTPLEPANVVVWELLLVLRWLEDALRRWRGGERSGHPPETCNGQLRAILRRNRA